jgi:NAD(P)-dependent dehydrogenase (short-subunit alcohol dehydrogenase family)
VRVRKRNAFVTGAATGIGSGLLEKLDREGWQVFAGYNRTLPAHLAIPLGAQHLISKAAMHQTTEALRNPSQ